MKPRRALALLAVGVVASLGVPTASQALPTAFLIAFAMITTTSQPAMANAAIAKKTGQACAKCHSAPPALNAYGQKYKEGKK